jgi:hypothetical protein
MIGVPTVKRFIVELLAIPGKNGDLTFTVHIQHPGGDVYSQSRSHEKASALFDRILKKASGELSGTSHNWLDKVLNEGDGVYRP